MARFTMMDGPFADTAPSTNVENRVGESLEQMSREREVGGSADYAAHRQFMDQLMGAPIPTASQELSQQAGFDNITNAPTSVGALSKYQDRLPQRQQLFDAPTSELSDQYAGLWDKLFPREKPNREQPGPQLQNPEGAFNIPLVTGRGQGGVMKPGAPIEQMGVVRGEGRLSKGRNLGDAQLADWLGLADRSREDLEHSRDHLARNRGGLSTSREGRIATMSEKDVDRALKLINARISSMQLDEQFAPLVREIARRAQFTAEGGQVSTGGSPVEKRYGGSKWKVPDFGGGTAGELQALRGWLESTKRDRDLQQGDPELNRIYRTIHRRLRDLEGK